MKYIESWLTGLGLQDLIPKLEASGITTPKKLAALTLKDMFEVVGVEDAEDRKKLYFLIQRLQTILNNKAAAGGKGSTAEDDATPGAPAEVPRVQSSALPPPPQQQQQVKNSVSSSGGTAVDPLALSGSASEEDLRVLRRKRRASVEPLPPPPPPPLVVTSVALARPPIANATAGTSASSNRPALTSAQPPKVGATVESIAAQAKADATVARASALPGSTKVLPKATLSSEPTLPSSHRRESINPAERNGRNGTAAAASLASSASSLQSSTTLSAASSLSFSLTSSTDGFAARGQKLSPSLLVRSSSPIIKVEPRKSSLSQQQPQQQQQQQPAKFTPPSSSSSSSALATGSTTAMPSTTVAATARQNSTRAAHSSSSPDSGPSHHVQQKAVAAAKPSLKASSSPVSSPTRSRPRERTTQPETANSTSSINSIPPPPPPLLSDSHGESAASQDDQVQVGQVRVEDMAIRVVVRKRPLSTSEIARGDRDVMEIRSCGEVHVHEPKTRVDLTKVIETTSFAFDDSFDDSDSNEVIYSRTVRPLVEFAFDGGKSSCFAYGQTGSGKTFTLMGSNPHDPASVTSNAGLYVLAARDIFAMRKDPSFHADKATGRPLTVVVSCFEIYGGKLFDLLNERNLVKCLEDAKGQVQVPGLTDHVVESVEDLLDLMSIAHEYRSVGTTGANSESSRSHLIMQLTLCPGQDRPNTAAGRRALSSAGKLAFIDLAGSERGADTTHNSKQTRMEGAEINTSLLALKEVIRSLERKHGHTPFRGSKLTQVLKDSFVGEKTRTCMIACASPSNTNCEHSLNTLRYADRVKEHQAGGAGGENVTAQDERRNSLSPFSARGDEAPARPATASGIPPSLENRRNSLAAADAPPPASSNAGKGGQGAKAAPAVTSRYSSAGGMAPISSNNSGHSPVRAGQGVAVGGSNLRRPSTGGNAPLALGGVAANKRAAPFSTPMPAPLALEKPAGHQISPLLQQHHPALAGNKVSPPSAAVNPSVPAAPVPKSGLQALAAAGTKLLQGRYSTASAAESSQATAPKRSIKLDLESDDAESSTAEIEEKLNRVAIREEKNPLMSSVEAENIRRTLSLLSAHKRTIADTVEVS